MKRIEIKLSRRKYDVESNPRRRRTRWSWCGFLKG